MPPETTEATTTTTTTPEPASQVEILQESIELHKQAIAESEAALQQLLQINMKRIARLNGNKQLVIEERLLDADIWELVPRGIDIVQLMLLQLLRNTTPNK